MRIICFVLLIGLAACTVSDATTPPPPVGDAQNFRMLSGKAPTRAEHAALVATCEERVGVKPVEACLADFGLRPAVAK